MSKLKSQNSKVQVKMQKFATAKERRKYLTELLKIDLSSISNFSFAEEQVKNHNIENLIGAVQIPLGVAGPIKINGSYTNGDFYLPLATTEGALVASVSRGCKAVTKSGGVNVAVENAGATRAPVFRTAGIKESRKFIDFVNKNYSRVKNICEKTSPHLTLLEILPFMSGKNVWLRFRFDTKDAMGMNMVTIAADKVIKEFIEPETKVQCISLSGNLCVDKKASSMNLILGRGKKVWAETVIKREVMEEVLKTTPEKLNEVARRKILYGSSIVQALGANAQAANVIAAIFCATGQDLGHVGEGSIAFTTTELEASFLYISCYLPDLMIGTVGGGTGLSTQKETLAILGIPDPNLKEGEQVLKLAEVIAAAVLAGELSLLAALSNGDLAKAHERLGRGR